MTKSALVQGNPSGTHADVSGATRREQFTSGRVSEVGRPAGVFTATRPDSTPSPTLEDTSTTSGDKHPCHHHRGGSSRPYVRAGRQDGTHAETLARPRVLVARCSVRPLARVRQLAHLQPAICQRLPVHPVHVDERGRFELDVGVRVAARAAVPGVPCLVARRGQLARMAEHLAGLRSEVAA